MTDQCRPRPAEQAIFRSLDEGAVVLHLGSGEYHGLNTTGAMIWELLDGRRLAEVACALRARMADTPCELEEHVRLFVHGLARRGLVTV
jgi:hypothetical protein